MGELAALATAFFWAFSSVFFTSASKEIGPLNTNRARLILAVLVFLFLNLIVSGTPLPLNATPERWMWLSLSGIFGLVLGDTALFQCYVLVGNRLGTLVIASVPVISTLMAWALMGEMMSLIEIVGMLVCVSGIALVVLDGREGNGAQHTRKQYALGILLGTFSAVCQAAAMTLAKKGLGGGFPPLSAAVIRMLAALVVIWSITLLAGKGRSSIQALLNNRRIQKVIVGGTICGPVIGVWLYLISIQSTLVGVSSTLMALTPVVMLPIARFYYKEQMSFRVVIGTITALAGAAIIFLVP